MNNPYKIIHSFKNDNRQTQYLTYIFVGNFLDKDIMNVLESIKSKSLYDSLIKTGRKNLKLLEDFYGERWYTFFFNKRHIIATIKEILAKPKMKKELTSKFDKRWVEKHINIHSNIQKIKFSYSENYRNYLFSKNKIKTLIQKREKDFTTHEIKIDEDIINLSRQSGGTGEEVGEDLVNTKLDSEIEKLDGDNTNEQQEVIEEDIVEDFNIDDLLDMYSVKDIDSKKEVTETSKLISKALDDKKWEKSLTKTSTSYNGSLDEVSYKTELEDSFEKVYITENYIYADDTVKNLKNKITASISLNPKFNKDLKFIPEYQYLWTDYIINNSIDYVMLGQKWIRKNDLLKVDIIPNDRLQVYETLRNNLSYLKDNFGYKIKREDDENIILRDYDEYLGNNDIYLLDIMNELGLNYDVEEIKLKNLYDVYIKIYFPLLSWDRFINIVSHLNGKGEKELDFNRTYYLSIQNDLRLEKEIYDLVEETQIKYFNTKEFKSMYHDNYILHSTIYINLNNPKNITGTVVEGKFSLYRIFDNFIVDDEFPFIQYNNVDGQTTYKFKNVNINEDKQELLKKWFETQYAHGLVFRIRRNNDEKYDDNKYVSVKFLENGRIDYSITWKEKYKATIEDIKDSYEIIYKLLKKINRENNKIKIIPPEDEDFKYAFINSIQKFELPKNLKINHNDLSEFGRLFFPYISIVIDPKKRTSKNKDVSELSKTGTYLRYKRISNYENRTRIHMRILYYIRNYVVSDKDLIKEIANQFNITDEVSAKELDFVKEKYSNIIKKTQNISKKMTALPKTNQPGIEINIVGKDPDNYKLRITGARNKFQLDEIVKFIKTLLFLYSQTYLLKKEKYQKLKNKLKLLHKIAKRRNKVAEYVDYEREKNSIKDMIALDKSRLGYKPSDGQNQWSRECQNSGDVKRQPLIFSGNQEGELIKMGYKYNDKSGFYEKKTKVKVSGKTYETTLVVAKLPNEEGNFNYYACDPSHNNEHSFIGFLSKSDNPSNLCAPCCFKKDHALTNNDRKRNYHMKCLGNKGVDQKVDKIDNKAMGDKVYILTSSNKVQEGRFILLPKYLDYFFNKIHGNDKVISKYYFSNSKSGYFFKYTVKDKYYNYLAALSNIYDVTIDDIKNKMIKFIKEDKDEIYFIYLNNGQIKESFKTRNNFIDYIKESTYLEYDVVGELLEIPGVLDPNGIFNFIIERRTKVIKKKFENDQKVHRYYLKCLNNENNFMLNDDKRTKIFLVKEGRFYFPIYKLKKDGKNDKKIQLTKKYKDDKIISELKNYYNKSCINNIVTKITKNSLYQNKNVIKILEDKKIKIKSQIIDNKNKCKYLELDNNLILPVVPSGTYYEYKHKSIDNITFNKFDKSIELVKKIEKTIGLNYIPSQVFYDKKVNNSINVVSIMFTNGLILPVKPEKINISKLKKLKLDYQMKTLESIIDESIVRGFEDKKDNIGVLDTYVQESYNILRLELSTYLEKHSAIRNSIINIVRNDKINKQTKRKELYRIIVDLLNKKLKKGSSKDDLVHIIGEYPKLDDYLVSNVRNYCKSNKTKDKCNVDLHCLWASNDCKLQLKYNDLIEFINRLIEEMVQNKIKFQELIQEDQYFVSDIIDQTKFTYRNDQKIVKTTNFNIKRIMKEIFGENQAPTVGKKIIKKEGDEIEEDYLELIELGNIFIQPVIKNMDSVIRAFVNSMYWLNNPLYDTKSRNLGYMSDLQTKLTNILKAQIVDFILNNYNNKSLNRDTLNTLQDFVDMDNFFDSKLNEFRSSTNNTNGIIELLALSYIYNYTIVVYDNFNNVKYVFENGFKNNKDTKKLDITKTIFIKFDFEENNTVPYLISSIYKKK